MESPTSVFCLFVWKYESHFYFFCETGNINCRKYTILIEEIYHTYSVK